MKLLVLCAIACTLLVVSLAGPVKIQVKDTGADSASDESGETPITKSSTTNEDSSSEEEAAAIKAKDNTASEDQSSEEINDLKPSSKTNNIIKDNNQDDSSDSTEDDLKTKEHHFLVVVDDDFNVDIRKNSQRRKRAIRSDVPTNNHIKVKDLGTIEYENYLKLKRLRRSDGKSSEEDSSEENTPNPEVQAVAAVKPEKADASTLEGVAVVAHTTAETEASSPVEAEQAEASTLEGVAVVAHKPEEAEASSPVDDNAIEPPKAEAARRRRNAIAYGEDDSSEEPLIEPRRKRSSKKSSEEQSSEEVPQGIVVIAAKPDKAEESSPADVKPEDATARRKRSADKSSEEHSSEEEPAAGEQPQGVAVIAIKPDNAEESSPADVKPEDATASRKRNADETSEEHSSEEEPTARETVAAANHETYGGNSLSNEELDEFDHYEEYLHAEADARRKRNAGNQSEENTSENSSEEKASDQAKKSAARRKRYTHAADGLSSEELTKAKIEINDFDYNEVIVSLSEDEQQKTQDILKNEASDKYYLLKDNKDTEEMIESEAETELQQEILDSIEDLKREEKATLPDNSDEDYVKGCEGNDATNDSNEWNETSYD